MPPHVKPHQPPHGGNPFDQLQAQIDALNRRVSCLEVADAEMQKTFAQNNLLSRVEALEAAVFPPKA